MNLVELQFLGRALSDLAVRAMAGDVPEDAVATAAGLPPAEAAVLGRVLEEPGLSVGELAHRTLFTQGRVSAVVAGFRDRGWMVTEPDPADRRRTRVWPSADVAAGRSKAFTTDAEVALRAILGPLTPDGRKAVMEGLAVLLRCLGDWLIGSPE